MPDVHRTTTGNATPEEDAREGVTDPPRGWGKDMGCNHIARDPFFPEEEGWHYVRICEHCGTLWYALHCLCDGIQNPCPGCGVRPTRGACPLEDEKWG